MTLKASGRDHRGHRGRIALALCKEGWQLFLFFGREIDRLVWWSIKTCPSSFFSGAVATALNNCFDFIIMFSATFIMSHHIFNKL